jgi:hypothetical protein
LHLLPVLIHPSEEEDLTAIQPLKACHHICQYLLISMAYVRRSICVVDGSSDVVGLLHLERKGGQQVRPIVSLRKITGRVFQNSELHPTHAADVLEVSLLHRGNAQPIPPAQDEQFSQSRLLAQLS